MKTFGLIGTLLDMKTQLKPDEKIVFYRKSAPYIIKKTWLEMLGDKIIFLIERR
ncbi:MAG: hypothetical protein ABIG95_02675 [Candidatus Woesearchaeota archaeon]